MQATQADIDHAVKIYNQVTKAHKRAPVQAYVAKQLSADESVELRAGHPRWTSALVFSGSPDDMSVEFAINQSVPASFVSMLEKMKDEFDRLIKLTQ